MENTQLLPPDSNPVEESIENKGCANCGHLIIEPGYATPLCQACRAHYVRFPIPKSIIAFAAGIGLVLIFAMFQMQKNLSAGIHFERGKTAMDNGRYFTAEKEFEKVRAAVPTYKSVREYLALAAFYNQNLDTFMATVSGIMGKEVENHQLFSELNTVIDRASYYLPSDTFNSYLKIFPENDSFETRHLQEYMDEHPDDLYPVMLYASKMITADEFGKCDTALNTVLAKDNSYFTALYLKSSLKRQIHQPDSALYYCDRILSLNRESQYGLASKARTYLQMKRDKEGMEFAMQSYELDPSEPYAKATMALAYHYNNKPTERDKLFEETKPDSLANSYMTFVHDVVEGREQFRQQ